LGPFPIKHESGELLFSRPVNCSKFFKQLHGPALEPFASMYAVDRSQYGFTPIPKAGPVSITDKSFFDSEAALHFSGNPSRTISFRWDGKVYHWFGEQETFEGPRMWDTDDGRLHEKVMIAFYKEAVRYRFRDLTSFTAGLMKSSDRCPMSDRTLA
jgi:hypothetical protein